MDNERSRFLIRIIYFIRGAYESLSGCNRCVLHDSLAAGLALGPELVRTELHHVDIETARRTDTGNERRRQKGVDTPLGEPNVQVALEIDATRFKKTFMESLHSWAREG